jgi:threonine dehydrogenase-like Zn-dependent dehydrogenase
VSILTARLAECAYASSSTRAKPPRVVAVLGQGLVQIVTAAAFSVFGAKTVLHHPENLRTVVGSVGDIAGNRERRLSVPAGDQVRSKTHRREALRPELKLLRPIAPRAELL